MDFGKMVTELMAAGYRRASARGSHGVVPHGWFDQWSSGLVFYHIL